VALLTAPAVGLLGETEEHEVRMRRTIGAGAIPMSMASHFASMNSARDGCRSVSIVGRSAA
jgi:hypothetical protein